MISTMPDESVEIGLNVFDLYSADSVGLLGLFFVCFYLPGDPIVNHVDFVWEIDVIVFTPCFDAGCDLGFEKKLARKYRARGAGREDVLELDGNVCKTGCLTYDMMINGAPLWMLLFESVTRA